VLIYLKRNLLLINQKIYRLFHIVLLFWGVSNLMLNISQGERFLVLFSFMAIGLFFTVYVTTKDLARKTIFGKFLYFFVPLLFIFGLMAAYSSNEMFIAPFFISNFFIEIFNYA
jgi:predicted membrane protein